VKAKDEKMATAQIEFNEMTKTVLDESSAAFDHEWKVKKNDFVANFQQHMKDLMSKY
jgi:hypothetical protein